VFSKVSTYSCKSKVSKNLSYKCSLDVSHFFRNFYTIDMLLRIVDEYPDEFKILGSSALNLLCRDSLVQGLFKQFGACEKLIS